MCGIVGMIKRNNGGFLNKDLDIFNQLLYADALRGDDSTGVFGVRESGNVDILKEASCSAAFMLDKRYDEFQGQTFKNHKFVVGHNRKATKGKIDDTSAHPFYEGDVVLVHNGTLFNHKELEDTQVDSHAICHAFNKHGHQKTLNKINGAYALAWYDARDKMFRLVRNNERPLGIVKNNTHYFFASEPNLLYWILSRNDVSIAKEKLELIWCEPNMIYEFPLDRKFNDPDMFTTKVEVMEVASFPAKKSDSDTTTLQNSGKTETKVFLLEEKQEEKKSESVRKSSAPYLAPTHESTISFKMKGWATKKEMEKNWPTHYADDCDVMITGYNPKWPNATIRAYTNSNKMNGMLHTVSEDTFTGKVIGHSHKNGNLIMISLVNIEPAVNIKTKNGLEITQAIWTNVSHTCDICSALVSFTQLPDCQFTYTKTREGHYRKNKLLCPRCSRVAPVVYGDYYCGDE